MYDENARTLLLNGPRPLMSPYTKRRLDLTTGFSVCGVTAERNPWRFSDFLWSLVALADLMRLSLRERRTC